MCNRFITCTKLRDQGWEHIEFKPKQWQVYFQIPRPSGEVSHGQVLIKFVSFPVPSSNRDCTNGGCCGVGGKHLLGMQTDDDMIIELS